MNSFIFVNSKLFVFRYLFVHDTAYLRLDQSGKAKKARTSMPRKNWSLLNIDDQEQTLDSLDATTKAFSTFH